MGRRGVALVMALVALAVTLGLAAAALAAARARVNLSAADRWATESRLVVASELAEWSTAGRDRLDSLADGETRTIAAATRPDGWEYVVTASRRAALVRLVAEVRRRDAAGRRFAARRATLLLARGPADTVRVLRHHARF